MISKWERLRRITQKLSLLRTDLQELTAELIELGKEEFNGNMITVFEEPVDC